MASREVYATWTERAYPGKIMTDAPAGIKVVNADALTASKKERDRLIEDKRELMEALEWYADKKNWHNDDWGILAVVAPPDYDDCGRLARATLDKIKAREADDESSCDT